MEIDGLPGNPEPRGRSRHDVLRVKTDIRQDELSDLLASGGSSGCHVPPRALSSFDLLLVKVGDPVAPRTPVKRKTVAVFFNGAAVRASREAGAAKNGFAGSARIDDRLPCRASGPRE